MALPTPPGMPGGVPRPPGSPSGPGATGAGSGPATPKPGASGADPAADPQKGGSGKGSPDKGGPGHDERRSLRDASRSGMNSKLGASGKPTLPEKGASPVASAKAAGAEAAKSAAAGAVTASTGVPLAVTRPVVDKATKVLRRAWPVVAGAALLVLLLILLPVVSALLDDDGLEYALAERPGTEIPTGFLDAYREAGASHDVPWTLLAGIGKVATDHGRRSPYDQVDRDPNRPPLGGEPKPMGSLDPQTGQPTAAVLAPGVLAAEEEAKTSAFDEACPTVEPFIGIQPEQAKGPMLIVPAAVTADEARRDPHNICEAADLVAERVSRVAEELAGEQNLSVGELDAPGADKFWGEVVDRLGIVADPSGLVPKCGLPSETAEAPTPVAVKIQILWRCRLVVATDLKVVSGAERAAGGSWGYQTMAPNQAQTALVAEALAVSWAWSQWGAAPCNNASAGPTGVFPLTKEVAARHGAADRCNAEANINAAVEALVAVERSAPALRPAAAGPFAPMQGGWATMAFALGEPPTAATFAATGPYVAWVASPECSAAIATWLAVLADKAGSPFLGLTTETVAGAEPAVAAAFLASAPDPRADPRCAGDPAATVVSLRPPDDRSWAAALAESAGAQATLDRGDAPAATAPGGPATTPTTAPGGLPKIDDATWQSGAVGLAAYLQLRSDQATPAGSAPVARLSPNGTGTTYPTPPSAGYSSVPVSIGAKVVVVAVYYGGLVDGDERAGREAAAAVGGGGQALGIVIDTASGYDFYPSGGLVRDLSTCGSRSNPAFYTRNETADAWERMCADMTVAGINLAVSSGARDYAKQLSLYLSKPGLAAKPHGYQGYAGGSNHERGIALDLGVSINPPALNWLHNVVGCYDKATNKYTPYPAEIPYMAFASAIDSGAQVPDVAGTPHSVCAGAALPIKRVQTYGFVFGVCGRGDKLRLSLVIRCSIPKATLGGENWHVELGQPLQAAGGGSLDVASCGADPQNPALVAGGVAVDVNNPQSMAMATHRIFYCHSKAAGLDTVAPTALANGAGPSPFRNKAEQIAAEAVVVGYCESGYSAKNATSNNPYGYGGVFQFGNSETARWIPGGNKFDPAANITGAARYFFYGYGKGKWDGWGPWAIVNTDYGGPNVGVKTPVVPRFPSTRGGWEGRYSPGPMPSFATNPTQPISGSCSKAMTGQAW